VQGIFTRRLRKRIYANGQTNGRTNSQAEYKAVLSLALAPQCEQNYLIANSRKDTAKYRDFLDKMYEIGNGKPAKQRAKVVLKILDLNT
jgi:hypothetical protein